MALLFMDGFDAGDISQKWNYVDSLAPTTSTRFGSGYAVRGGSVNGAVAQKSIEETTELFIGFAYRHYNNGYLRRILSFYGDSGTTEHISLKLISVTGLGLYHGSTLLGTAEIYADAWSHIEMRVIVNDVSGVAILKINGETKITHNGDTKNGGTNNSIDLIQLGERSPYGANDSAYDDLYLCDSTGTTNNTFLGDVRVQSLVPNAAGANTDFTPTGGANYANVADIPDDTGTYNTSSTVGHKDTYDFSDLVSGTGTVFGIQTNMHAKKADAGLGALKEIVVAGSTTYDGNTTQLPTSTAWIGQIRETNPDTSTAWTVGDVNSLEAGAEVA